MRTIDQSTDMGSRDTGSAGPGPFDPPFEIVEPVEPLAAVVFSSPHSGNHYPERFLRASRLDALTLRRSEDAFVDDLFLGVVEAGCPLVRALFPRAWLDVNREPYELDPRMFDGRLPAFANTRSIRVAGGLGTIARVVGEAQEIYASRLSVADAMDRIETLYKPYHASLAGLMRRAAALHGAALLVDCHSMPSSAAKGAGRGDETARIDIVLGDRYGASCDSFFTDTAESELLRMGYIVRRNKPYAGGFITETYGAPANGWHALQIEINRALYMDEKAMLPGHGYDSLKRDLASLGRVLADVCGAAFSRRAAAE